MSEKKKTRAPSVKKKTGKKRVTLKKTTSADATPPKGEGDLLHMLLDTIPDAIYFKDLKSRFVRVSRGWMKKSGIKKETTILGKTDFDIFTLEHARQAFKDEQEIIRTGKPIVGIEEKETWPNRPDTWVSTTKMPLKDRSGKTIGTFGISRDITEVKKYRDALQKAKDDLEERVRERTAQLSEAKYRLEQHVEQLKFLNTTAFELAPIVHIEEMFGAVGSAFLARFPFAQMSICQKVKNGFSCVHATGVLDMPEARSLSEKALASFTQTETARLQVVEQWPRNDRLKLPWPKALKEFPCWIAIPLQADNAVLAVIQIFAPSQGVTVFKQEQTLLSTLAAHAATRLSNALHYQYLEVKARLEGELEAARNIQRSLMPRETPSIPRLSLAGEYLPAYEVSGDYLDYFQCGDGGWVAIIADVCGKGVPAALLMSVLRSIARFEARFHYTARSLLCAINDSIYLNINERSFITALCLVIDAEGTSMTYARAGHPKLLRMEKEGERISVIESKGPALGILQNIASFDDQLEEVTIPLAGGETYLAYTDGLTEATGEKKNAYGLARLTNVMRDLKHEPVQRMVARIIADAREFTHNKPLNDDLTMLALKVAE
ncbi:MAG: SpoIIE family protein phosphatase [Chitinispirillaceae bacterium]|nr:SpoIIE family protein phosphatase [Chitinispirillaceae bacterium]